MPQALVRRQQQRLKMCHTTGKELPEYRNSTGRPRRLKLSHVAPYAPAAGVKCKAQLPGASGGNCVTELPFLGSPSLGGIARAFAACNSQGTSIIYLGSARPSGAWLGGSNWICLNIRFDHIQYENRFRPGI